MGCRVKLVITPKEERREEGEIVLSFIKGLQEIPSEREYRVMGQDDVPPTLSLIIKSETSSLTRG